MKLSDAVRLVRDKGMSDEEFLELVNKMAGQNESQEVEPEI